jgi:hypothetical protein
MPTRRNTCWRPQCLHHRRIYGALRIIAAGYRELPTPVVIKGDGTKDQFRWIHELVLAASPNFFSITRAVSVAPTLIIE